MVIFVEPEFVQTVLSLRQGKLDYTKVIAMSKYDLELYQFASRVRHVMKSQQFLRGHQLLYHPEGFSPFYNIISNSKVSLVHNVTKDNTFNSDYFYWADFGYGHGNTSLFPKSCSWLPEEIMTESLKDKITYLKIYDAYNIKSTEDFIKLPVESFIAGGFFGGSKVAIENYYKTHRTTFAELLDNNFVDDDQALAAASYFKDPSLFHFVPGSWFDAFKVLGQHGTYTQ